MVHRLRFAAVAAVAAGLAFAPAAQSREWHGHGGYHHGNNAGAAIAAGIIGFGLGAAIASNGGYYAPPPPVYYGYGPPPGQYYGPPPAVYYGY